MANNLGNLIVNVNANVSGFNISLGSAQRTLRNFSQQANIATSSIAKSTGVLNNILQNSFRYIVLHAIIVKGVLMTIRGTVQSVRNAMNMVESENLFNVSMGNMAKTARSWSMELQRSLGLNAYEVRKNVGIFYTMTKSMGLTATKAYDVSTNITKLAYDMSSFYNIPYTDAFTKLQAGLTGEIEPLRRLGIIVTDNVIKNWAYTNGLAKQGAVLTEQQKVLARYGVIMESTATAQGDLARTLNSPANQARLLSTIIQLLSINVGRIFIPIVQSAIPVLNTFMQTLSNLADRIAQFMESLFGVSYYSNFTDSTNAAAGAQDDLADSTAKAGKAAKNSLMAFDELYALNNSNLSGGSSSGDDGGSTPSTPGSGSAGQVKSLSDVFKELFSGPLFQPLIDSLNTLKTALEPLTQNLFSGLRWLYDNVLEPLGRWVIGNAIPAFLNVLTGAINLLNPIIEALKPLGIWLWENFLKPMLNWAGGAIVDTLNWLAKVLTDIGNWVKEHQPLVEDLAIAVGAVVAAFITWNTIISILGLVDKAIAGVGIALTFIEKHPVVLALSALIAVVALLATHWDDVKKAATDAWNWIQQTWQNASNWLGVNVVRPIGTFFSNLWSDIKKGSSDAWDWVSKTWKSTSNWFGVNVVRPTGKFFSGLWSDLSSGFLVVWNGIKSIFEPVANWFYLTVIKPIGDFFKGMLNLFVDALNVIINALNSLKLDVPDWVADILGIERGSTFGFNIAPIKRLAQGALAYGPVAAIVGDNPNASTDPEVISPLSKLQNMTGMGNQAVIEILAAILNAVERVGNQPIELDRERITRVITNLLDQEDNRIGKRMISVGGATI